MFAKVLTTARSSNAKTGDVPTAWIGGTRTESIRTCQEVGCPLLHKRHGGKGGDGAPLCYAQHGSPAFGHSSTIKAVDRGADRSPEQAIKGRAKSARMVRIGAIGDPAFAERGTLFQLVALARAENLAVVGYTHGWRRKYAADLKDVCMASCDTLEDADKAADAGWKPVVVLPDTHKGRTFMTPAGRKGIVCPAMMKPGKVTCNDCRLCDPARPGPVIGFPDHGPGSERRAK